MSRNDWVRDPDSIFWVRKARKPPGKVRVIVTEARLNALRDHMATPIRVGLVKGFQSIKQNLSADDLRTAFMKKDYSAILEQVGDHVGDVVKSGLQGAVKQTMDRVKDAHPELDTSRFRVQANNDRVKEHIAQTTGNLITTSEDGISQAVKRMTTGALSKGMSFQQSANAIRDSIGLNAPQETALSNYRAGLASQGLTGDRLGDLVAAQSDRMLDYRAMMIARTEVRNAQNFGELETWRQGIDEGLLPKNSKKVWQVDGKPCAEWCEQMDGEPVEIDSPWRVESTVNGRVVYVDYPSAIHPQCQCMQRIELGDD